MDEKKEKIINKKGNRLRNIVIGLALIAFFLTFPFLIPISTYRSDNSRKPFAESNFITENNIDIHYREWNSNLVSPTRKIVMIHGFYGSTASWDKVVDKLKKSNDYIVTIDLPGFGYSSKQSGMNYSTDFRTELVWKILNDLDKKNHGLSSIRWTLIGHSLGGGIVANMTLQNPQLVRELILIDPAINYSEEKQNYLLKFLDNPISKRYVSLFANYYFFQSSTLKNFLASAYGQEPTDDQVNSYLKPLQEAGTSISGADIVFGSDMKQINVKDIKNRTLIIWGEKDTWIDFKDAKYLDENIVNSELNVIVNAGHVPQETHSQEVVNQIVDFWGRRNQF